MIRLQVEAPFAAFRPVCAGKYRNTARFMTHSAAYGFLLNLAGIESRRDDQKSIMTVTQLGLPRAIIALGSFADKVQSTIQSLYQQLHNYPVGSHKKENSNIYYGRKYNISPVRREFLSCLKIMITADFPDNPEVETAILQTIKGEDSSSRYGLPFLGDNSFMVDKIKVGDGDSAAVWYSRITDEDIDDPIPYSTTLTTWIVREDMSKTESGLFAPLGEKTNKIPEAAWVSINPPAKPKLSKKAKPPMEPQEDPEDSDEEDSVPEWVRQRRADAKRHK